MAKKDVKKTKEWIFVLVAGLFLVLVLIGYNYYSDVSFSPPTSVKDRAFSVVQGCFEENTLSGSGIQCTECDRLEVLSWIYRFDIRANCEENPGDKDSPLCIESIKKFNDLVEKMKKLKCSETPNPYQV